eukprot:5813970-Amphidinium_carterae.1
MGSITREPGTASSEQHAVKTLQTVVALLCKEQQSQDNQFDAHTSDRSAQTFSFSTLFLEGERCLHG